MKCNFILLQINKANKNIFILSNTKNIYSFYKKVSSNYYQYNKWIIFLMDNQDFFFSLKSYFYFLEFLKQYNFFFTRKNFSIKKKFISFKKKKYINTNILLNHYNRAINNIINKYINSKFLDNFTVTKNKFFFYRYGIFFLNKKKNYNKKIDFFLNIVKKRQKNIILKKFINIHSIKFFLDYIANQRKKLFSSIHFFLNLNTFFLNKKSLVLNWDTFFLVKKKQFFFFKKKKLSFLNFNFNYYRYIYFFNFFYTKRLKYFLKQKSISSLSNFSFLSKTSFSSKSIIDRFKWIYSNFSFFKLDKKVYTNSNSNSNSNINNTNNNTNNNKKNSTVYFSNDIGIRSYFKNIYIYYFFLFYKKKLKEHFFSNLFNFFFSIKKERLILKKKLTLFFNINSIGIIYYKNTLKNVFLTLSTFKGKHLYHISSGHIKFFGRKKVFYKTIFNLTRRFLFKIKDRLVKNNIFYVKVIINGFFNDVFVFLRPFLKKYYYFSKIYYIFKNYIFFLKKYLLYLKSEMKKNNFFTFLNLNKYFTIISHCYSLFSYIKYKLKRNYYLNIKLVNIQIKSKKFFSN